MKREHGLWYVKYCGVWMVAGETVHDAVRYFARIKTMRAELDKAMGAR